MLRFAYSGMRGRLRFLSDNTLARFLLKRLVLQPIGLRGDTAHPLPTADVLKLIDDQTSAIAVGPCRCRVAHGQCRHRLETDMVIRTGVEAFTKAWPHDYRELARDEAKRLIEVCADEGLWHMVFLHLPTAAGANEYVICNCCTDGCVPFMLNKVFGQDGFPLVRGEHVAHTLADRCRGCGDCLAVCPWEARTLVDGVVAVDSDKCFGCGLCARVCRNGGVSLVRERPRPPLRTYLEQKSAS
jgi:ferredoxin